MELKEFISNTIKEITDGIIEGNQYIKEKSHNSEGISDDYKQINFDIAVTTNEEEKDNIGGKVSVAQIFSAGGSNENVNKYSNVSRIKFDLLIQVKTES